jgi:hypothetical protein
MSGAPPTKRRAGAISPGRWARRSCSTHSNQKRVVASVHSPARSSRSAIAAAESAPGALPPTRSM